MDMKIKGGLEEMYYVILRGSEGKNILANESDKMKFLRTLEELKSEAVFKVGAYCILDNQVELLLEISGMCLTNTIENLINMYSDYIYNIMKIQSDTLLTVYHQEQLGSFTEVINTSIRMHNKPVKFNIVQNIEHYWWSSYRAYKSYNNQKAHLASPILDGDIILGEIDKDIKKAIRIFVKYHKNKSLH